jgi:hypothetical protein
VDRIKENKNKQQQDMNQKPYQKVVPQVMVKPMTTVQQRYNLASCFSIIAVMLSYYRKSMTMLFCSAYLK